MCTEDIWETDFWPLLVLARRGAAPAKVSTGNNFPGKYQRKLTNNITSAGCEFW